MVCIIALHPHSTENSARSSTNQEKLHGHRSHLLASQQLELVWTIVIKTSEGMRTLSST